MALSLFKQHLRKLLMVTVVCCVAPASLELNGSNSEIASRFTGPQTTRNNNVRYIFGNATGKDKGLQETTENRDTSIWDEIYTKTVSIGVTYKNGKEVEESTADHFSVDSVTTLRQKDAKASTKSNIANISERTTVVGDGKVTINIGTSDLISSSVTTTSGAPSSCETTSGPTALSTSTAPSVHLAEPPLSKVSSGPTVQRPLSIVTPGTHIKPSLLTTPSSSIEPPLSKTHPDPPVEPSLSNTPPGFSVEQPLSTATNSSVDDYWQKKVHDDIITFVSPILIVSGTFGNALSAVILQNRLFRSSSTGFILTALALLDITVLNTGLMQIWLAQAFNIKIRNLSSFSCKLCILLTYYPHQLASWTMILLTIERSIAVCCPLRCREFCSKRRILFAWCSTAVLLFAANSLFLVSYDLLPKVKTGLTENATTVVTYECDVHSEWLNFLQYGWCLIDTFFGDVFPSAVILICNIITVTKIVHSKRPIQPRQTNSASRRKEKMASTTAMLMGASLFFLMLTLPLDAFLIYFAYHTTDGMSGRDLAISDLVYAVVTMLYYANNALDFLVYFVSGRKFRQALLETFLPCRKSTNGNSQNVTHTHGDAAINNVGTDTIGYSISDDTL